MNILMLNYEFPPIGGGASPVSYDIGKRIVECGHRITVVTMAYGDLPLYEVKDGMDVYRVKCWRTQRMVCHPWEQATYIILAYDFIKRKLQISDFDICYTHFIIPTGVISWLLKKKYNLSYIITAHGSDVIGHNNKRFRMLYSLLKRPWCSIVSNASSVTSPSEHLINLMRMTESRAKYVLIPNGIDSAFFIKGKEKKKKILIMCRLQETKNVQCIIRALSRIDLNGWVVDIVGDGPYREQLKRLVEKYCLEQKICFRGWIINKSKEHLKVLQEAAIYISASRVENCPTSILEAIACGSNVLLSDIPAHRQLIGNLDNNIYFAMDDDKQLSIKVQKLINEFNNGLTFSNSYDIRRFDWKNSIGKYLELLEKYADKNGVAGWKE